MAMISSALRTYRITRQNAASPVFFWLVQVILGIPSLLQALNLVITGKAEGALFMIALFLAWIGATLAVGVAALVHGKMGMELPAIFRVRVAAEAGGLPDGYQDFYRGFPFRVLDDGRVEVLTVRGQKTYGNWAEFVKETEPR
jgi:hypothetical protein